MPHRMAAVCQHASAAGCATTVLEMLQTGQSRLTQHKVQLPMELSSALVLLPTCCRYCKVVCLVWACAALSLRALIILTSMCECWSICCR